MLRIRTGNYLQELQRDTGSTFSIVQKAAWKELNKKGSDQFTTTNQSFMLANGQSQTAIITELFLMEDKDLSVPVILGLDLQLFFLL